MEAATIQRIIDNATPSPIMDAAQASIPLLGESCFGIRIGAREEDVTPKNDGETKSLAREWRTATRKQGGGKLLTATAKLDGKEKRIRELQARWYMLSTLNPGLIEGEGEKVAGLADGEDYSHLNPQSGGDDRYAELRMGKLSACPANNFGGSRDVGDGV